MNPPNAYYPTKDNKNIGTYDQEPVQCCVKIYQELYLYFLTYIIDNSNIFVQINVTRH